MRSALWTVSALLTAGFAGSPPEGKAEPSKPLFERKPIFVSGLDGVREYRIPAFAVTKAGMLMAVCDARVERSGDAPNNIDLVMKRSRDGGKTWEPMRQIVDFPGQEAACDPSLTVDLRTGRIWLFYDYAVPDPQAFSRRVIRLHAITSDDDGETWSEPVDMTGMAKDPAWHYAVVGPGRGAQARDGRLLVPGYAVQGQRKFHSHLYSSTDHGRTWRRDGRLPDCNEAAIVELADGTLMINMRSLRGKGCRAAALSQDGGRTWSEPADATDLIEPVCQASCVRYTDIRDGYAKNRLLFSNPAASTRTNMTVKLSYDEGKTWPVARAIHAGPAAYSCLAVLPGGDVGLLCEVGRENPYEAIEFVRFDLEWLTNGEDRLNRR